MDNMQKDFNKKIENIEKKRMFLNAAFENFLQNENDSKSRQMVNDFYRLFTISLEEIKQHLEAN